MLVTSKQSEILWVGALESPFNGRERFVDTMRLPILIKGAKALGKSKSWLCLFHTLTHHLEVNWLPTRV